MNCHRISDPNASSSHNGACEPGKGMVGSQVGDGDTRLGQLGNPVDTGSGFGNQAVEVVDSGILEDTEVDLVLDGVHFHVGQSHFWVNSVHMPSLERVAVVLCLHQQARRVTDQGLTGEWMECSNARVDHGSPDRIQSYRRKQLEYQTQHLTA